MECRVKDRGRGESDPVGAWREGREAEREGAGGAEELMLRREGRV